MGSCLSKQIEDGNNTGGPTPDLKIDPPSIQQDPAQKPTPFSSGASTIASIPSGITRQSDALTHDVSSVSTDPYHDQIIPWKIDEEELATRRTYKLTEKIRNDACTEFGIPKGRVALIDTVKGWFAATTGAYSPGNYMAGSVPKMQYDLFQSEYINPVNTIPDMTKVPEFATRPAVMHRPHLTFRSGLLLISTLTTQPHPLGYIFVWDSKPGEDLTDAQNARFEALAKEAVVALQRSMLEGIGAPTVLVQGKSDEKIDLPAVWVDLKTPEWTVVGINKQWELLTKVGLDILLQYPGFLSVIGCADGSSNEELKEAIRAGAAEVLPDRSIPAILSPRAALGSSLQFAVALKRARGPPPLPAKERGPASDLWMVEVHARVQADTHKGGPPTAHTHASPTHGNFRNSSHSGDSQSGGGSTSFPSGTNTSSGGRGGRSGPARERASGVPPRMANLEFGDMLGAGSYADVYSGYLGTRPVAIKVIEIPGVHKDKKDWGAHYEALLAVDVSHENVIKTYDWCRIEEQRGWQVWIVQELCDGGTLSSAIEYGMFQEKKDFDGSPDLHSILETAEEVAKGMAYIHSTGELHADLSANNVLLCTADNDRGFVAKVTDFGLARLQTSIHTTKTVGTVSYMPPEVLLEGIMSPAVDVYAFGVILWEMWCGQPAWAGLSHTQVIFAVSCRDEKLKLPEDAPENLIALMAKCMATEPADRPSFREIATEIEGILAELGPRPPKLDAPMTPPLTQEEEEST